MAKTKVGLLGASGETGSSIHNGLAQDGGFEVVALTRPASMSKPANQALKDGGVEVRAVDLAGGHADIVNALKDIEILISAIGPMEQLAQMPLATAAKEAGVKRFLPCAFVTAMPVGVHMLRDQKEEVYNHVKRLGLSYTIVDVGWWYQISPPGVPSGKMDYALGIPKQRIAGDGNVPSALTDLRDIGKYVAKIIADERTVNKYVLVYNEMWTQHQIWDAVERLSGEKLPREYSSFSDLQKKIVDADAKIAEGGELDLMTMLGKVTSQYFISWGVRGDNTPEYASLLGYVSSKELYPEFKYIKFEVYLQEVLGGKAKGVYEELKQQLAEALQKSGNS